jgi:hypothetical protein
MNKRLEDILLGTLEKAQEVGADIYDATKDGLAKAVDFAQEQVPALIKELLVWEFWYHAIHAVLWLLAFILLVYLFRKVWKYMDKLEEFGCMGVIVIPCVAIGILLGGLVPNITTCVKIKTAPRLFLIEYCADLVQTKQNQNYRREHNH